MLKFGDLLQNRYRITRQIGGGGMALVYLAEDTRLPGRKRAIKEMSPARLLPSDRNWAIAHFRQEAQILANLEHPGLARVTDFFPERGNWYLVMDYIEGETLGAHLNKANGRLSVEEALHITRQLCDVLAYLHNQTPQVIFRDLKPANVMLTSQGDVKLIDFGIARFFKPGKTGDTVNLGTPGYAAPEQYGQVRAQSGPSADVYSLGVLLLQMVGGYDPTNAPAPFPVPDPRSIMRTMPKSIAAVITRATQTQPDLRYGSIQAMQQALFPPPGAASPQPSGTKRWLLFGGGGLGILVVLGMCATVLWASGIFPTATPVWSPVAPTPVTPSPTVHEDEGEPESPIAKEVPTDTDVPTLPPTSTPEPTHQATDTPTPPTPTVEIPRRPERLAFVQVASDTDRSGKLTWDDRRTIYIMNPDGSDLQPLTDFSYDAYSPSWSPDRSQIVFTARYNTYWNLYIVNADRKSSHALTSGNSNDEGPSWSPDGARIAFHSDRDGDREIYVMPADGSRLTQLTHNRVEDKYPAWSPDSQRLVFCSKRDGNQEIYLMDDDGSGQTNLTQHPGEDYWPSWSPTGDVLAFMSNRDGQDDVYLLDLQNKSVSRLTSGAASCVSPTWSSDGRWLAFTCWQAGRVCEIYRMRLEDRYMEQLTRAAGLATRPAWSH